jgi:hypothetical protein
MDATSGLKLGKADSSSVERDFVSIDELQARVASLAAEFRIPLKGLPAGDFSGATGSGRITSPTQGKAFANLGPSPSPKTRSEHARLRLNSPLVQRRCNYVKREKARQRESQRKEQRYYYEVRIRQSGGTIGRRCRGGTRYTVPKSDVDRRSEWAREYNEHRAFFRTLVDSPATANLPLPSVCGGLYRSRAEADCAFFLDSQLLPLVSYTYSETSPFRDGSEVACSFEGRITSWERDFDLRVRHCRGIPPVQLAVKGTGFWYKELQNTVAATDYLKNCDSSCFRRFYHLFRDLANIGLRTFVNQLQVQFATDRETFAILWLSRRSLRRWLRQNKVLNSGDDLLALFEKESNSFLRQYRKLVFRLFPEEHSILTEAFVRTREHLLATCRFPFPCTAREIAEDFAFRLKEVKAARGYEDTRARVYRRYLYFADEINRLYRSTPYDRREALFRVLKE